MKATVRLMWPLVKMSLTPLGIKREKRVHEKSKKEQSEKEKKTNHHEARKEGDVHSDKCCRQAGDDKRSSSTVPTGTVSVTLTEAASVGCDGGRFRKAMVRV